MYSINNYFYKSIKFKEILINKIKKIFLNYENKLQLHMNNINLLENEQNSIKSSTAIGYCLEEFIVSNLLKSEDKFIIKRNITKTTQKSSFDFYTIFENDKFLINIKANKIQNNKEGSNNAVAAIEQLYNDYVLTDPEIIKHFLIIKINYFVADKVADKYIQINDVDGYFLEELDFSFGYQSDSRNWSSTYKHISSRIQISQKFYKKNKIINQEISYQKTYEFIKKIFDGEIIKIKKNKK